MERRSLRWSGEAEVAPLAQRATADAGRLSTSSLPLFRAQTALLGIMKFIMSEFLPL
jgi:hypothetical protein